MAPGLPNLVVDRLRIKQVLLNLLSNAVKFTPSGGKVALCADYDEAGRFILTVRDSGIGMAPKSISVALEPFRQIASPFARKVEGTGLGLALVKSLIECHGGKLEIESTLDHGTLRAGGAAGGMYGAQAQRVVGLGQALAFCALVRRA